MLLFLFFGNSLEVFEFLYTKFDIQTIFSHNESGTESSWLRDKSISKFCKQHNILWQESQQNGVVRGLKNRTHWAKLWNSYMSKPLVNNKAQKPKNRVFLSFYTSQKTSKAIGTLPKIISTSWRRHGLAVFTFFS